MKLLPLCLHSNSKLIRSEFPAQARQGGTPKEAAVMARIGGRSTEASRTRYQVSLISRAWRRHKVSCINYNQSVNRMGSLRNGNLKLHTISNRIKIKSNRHHSTSTGNRRVIARKNTVTVRTIKSHRRSRSSPSLHRGRGRGGSRRTKTSSL